jgi:hypothetical protein
MLAQSHFNEKEATMLDNLTACLLSRYFYAQFIYVESYLALGFKKGFFLGSGYIGWSMELA